MVSLGTGKGAAITNCHACRLKLMKADAMLSDADVRMLYYD